MKAEELRIGNFVRAKSPEKEVYQEPVKVDIHYLDMFCHDKKLVHFEPIPLTEEWLIRFGFEKVDYNHLSFSNGFVDFRWYPLVHGLEMEIEGQVLPLYTHQFVHQLQNLYFALTGKELTLSPPQR